MQALRSRLSSAASHHSRCGSSSSSCGVCAGACSPLWPAQLVRLAAAARCSALAPTTTSSSSSSSSSPAAGPGSRRPPFAQRRQRLDDHVSGLFPQHSKSLIQSWIAQGKVLVNDQVVTKAGQALPKNARVRVNAEEPRFVCRAGFKLEKALDAFGIDVAGLAALDAGLSTGGFTHCLLQRGVRHVYGVDVGHGQVMGSIAQDPRVTVMERTNLRHLLPSAIPEQVSLVTLDLSFISVLKVLPAVAAVVAPGGQLVVLIKPQFEAGRAQVGAGGVVRDPAVHEAVIKRITAGIEAYGFECRGVTESPLKGDKGGNTEFLAHFVHDPAKGPIRVPPEATRDEGGDR